jgi:O-antigen biosynthesis protein
MTTMTGSIVREHLHRYALARHLAHGLDVLDIASGEGYGSQLLAQVANTVIGVDVDPAAVQHAQTKYRRDNLSYRVGDAARIPVDEAAIDLAVSFETIEHIADQPAFLRELVRVLRPDGVAILSTPNVQNFGHDGPQNPFHVHELQLEEFRTLLTLHFPQHRLYAQRMWSGSTILPVDGDQAAPGFCVEVGDFKAVKTVPPGDSAVYLLAVTSKSTTQPLPSAWGLFSGPHDPPDAAEKYAACQQQLDSVLQSRSWQMTAPLRRIIEWLHGR